MNQTTPPRSAKLSRSSAEPPTPSPTNCIGTTTTCETYAAWRQARAATAAASSRSCCERSLLGASSTWPSYDQTMFAASSLGSWRSSHSHSVASQLASALRSYFRYRTICGDSVGGLTAVISSPVHWKLASLPRALKPDEVERLLSSFPDGRWPKRGYAIVRCALDMGLRAGEIAHLMISDIDWRAGTVTLRGTKSLTTGHPALADGNRAGAGRLSAT